MTRDLNMCLEVLRTISQHQAEHARSPGGEGIDGLVAEYHRHVVCHVKMKMEMLSRLSLGKRSRHARFLNLAYLQEWFSDHLFSCTLYTLLRSVDQLLYPIHCSAPPSPYSPRMMSEAGDEQLTSFHSTSPAGKLNGSTSRPGSTRENAE
jgi:hypothetical protein